MQLNYVEKLYQKKEGCTKKNYVEKYFDWLL